jgi:preprotein translocase subunit SecA
VDMVTEVIDATVAQYVSAEIYPEEWDLEGLVTQLQTTYPTELNATQLKEIENPEAIRERILQEAIAAYESREQELGESVMRELERMVILSVTDNRWREHLHEMDYLQEGIHLRAYGQRDPLVEYQREAHTMFEALKGSIIEEFVRYIFRVELVRQDEPARPRPQRLVQSGPGEQPQAPPGQTAGGAASSGKVPRNAPCPCGSGRKYKKCHGATA